MNHVPPGPEKDHEGCGSQPPGGHTPERCHHSSLGSTHIRGSEVRISYQAHNLETGGSSPPLGIPLSGTGKPTMRGSTPCTEVPEWIYSPDLPGHNTSRRSITEMQVACIWISGSDMCTYHSLLSCRPLPDCGFKSRLRLFLEKRLRSCECHERVHAREGIEAMHETSYDGCSRD